MEQARKISKEMITQRGYEIVSEDDDSVNARKPNGDNMIIYFVTDEKLNKKTATKYMSMMNDSGVKHSIIIYADKITTTTLKSLQHSHEIQLELFGMEEVQFNITKHRLQPKSFTRLTPTESKNFKNTYGVLHSVMKQNDVISRFYNFKRGDVIEVVQLNDVVTYKIVK